MLDLLGRPFHRADFCRGPARSGIHPVNSGFFPEGIAQAFPARVLPLHPSSAVGLDNTSVQIFVSTDFHPFGGEV